jgi:hypothetical protein
LTLLQIKLIHYIDGAIDVIQGPTTQDAIRPRFIHQQLREQLAQEQSLWPMDAEQVEALCLKYRPYFVALAQALRPAIAIERMSAQAQYEWFVATPPTEVESAQMLGLSHVEELMGIVRQSSSPDGDGDLPDESDIVQGTGDPLLDLIVDVHLVFKTAAPRLIAGYSVRTLHEMTAYAARRHEQAMARMKDDTAGRGKGRSSRSSKVVEDQPAVPVSPAIKARLEGMGIEMPD